MKIKVEKTVEVDVKIDPNLKRFLKKIYVWNRYKHNIKDYVRVGDDETDYIDSVTNSFRFVDTPEGFDFWQLVDWLWEEYKKDEEEIEFDESTLGWGGKPIF